jgi:serine/threonine protein kinase
MSSPGESGAPELGSEIAGYRLESVLGEGGMGTVYLARGRDGGLCAVKVLSRRLVAGDPTFATRFEREAQYADALEHPNVLELYEAGKTPDGTPFFAMQYVDGPDLGVLLRREGRLSLQKALSILGPIGDALDRAHANGLVHRDVKPGNIIVATDPDGPHPYLTDFGLSKNPGTDSFALTRMGQLIGTLAYTAPEEILATEGRGAAVDIYSLGCVMYEVLVGAPPFVRERDIDVLYAHVGDPRPSASEARADLPAGIDDVIARAMAISAPERYPSCTEFIAAVQGLGPGDSTATAPEGAAVVPTAPAAAAPAPSEAAVQLDRRRALAERHIHQW